MDRIVFFNRTECATPRTGSSQNEKGCSLVMVAFGKIGASGTLAHGIQVQSVENGFYRVTFIGIPNLFIEPGGFTHEINVDKVSGYVK